MENPVPTTRCCNIATLRSDDMLVFISLMSRHFQDLINEILRYKAKATSFERGGEQRGRKDDVGMN